MQAKMTAGWVRIALAAAVMAILTRGLSAAEESGVLEESDLKLGKSWNIHQRLSYRPWYAEVNQDVFGMDIDCGYGIFHQINYNLMINQWFVTALGAYGDQGWDDHDVWSDMVRWDGQIGFGRSFGALTLGASYRYSNKSYTLVPGVIGHDKNGQEIRQDDEVDETFVYHGPEFFAGLGIPIGRSGFSLSFSGTYMPYLWLEAEHDNVNAQVNNFKVDGDTTGWTVDGALRYTFKYMQVGAGYRIQTLNGEKFTTEKAGIFDTGDDQMAGPYAELSVLW